MVANCSKRVEDNFARVIGFFTSKNVNMSRVIKVKNFKA